jgi:large subunit ribosomal protein L19e
MKKQVHKHSRSRCKAFHEARRKGRHNGMGKRKGKKTARMPSQVLWMRRQRVLRRLLKKYRDAKKITKDLYHHFYLACKGNLYKNKSVLIEAIHKSKHEKELQTKLEEQAEARRAKNAIRKEKRIARKVASLGGAVDAKAPAVHEDKKAEQKQGKKK